jgi:hypothetical protein
LPSTRSTRGGVSLTRDDNGIERLSAGTAGTAGGGGAAAAGASADRGGITGVILCEAGKARDSSGGRFAAPGAGGFLFRLTHRAHQLELRLAGRAGIFVHRHILIALNFMSVRQSQSNFRHGSCSLYRDVLQIPFDTPSLRHYNSIGVAEVAEWQTRYVQGVVLERV